jgi:hypothetical protein
MRERTCLPAGRGSRDRQCELNSDIRLCVSSSLSLDSSLRMGLRLALNGLNLMQNQILYQPTQCIEIDLCARRSQFTAEVNWFTFQIN